MRFRVWDTYEPGGETIYEFETRAEAAEKFEEISRHEVAGFRDEEDSEFPASWSGSTEEDGVVRTFEVRGLTPAELEKVAA